VLLSPRVRKAALAAHVIASVGWLGGVVVFLLLAIAVTRSNDEQEIRGVLLAMELIGVGTLVPLSLLSFVSGLLQSFGTSWGLLRHYWVVAKLGITVVATAVLLLYVQTLRHFGVLARRSGVPVEQLQDPSPVLHSGGALVFLVAATVLSVFKPRGLTRRGWRYAQREKTRADVDGRSAG